MISKIKNITNTEDKKRLLSNFFSLSVLKLFSYIVPLLTLPYLIRVLGVETFGIVIMAQTIIVFFGIFVDFGFNLSATRGVSINRNDKSKMTEIYSSVLILKSFLLVMGFLFFLILIVSFDKFSDHLELYLVTFLSIISQVLFPVWYFQGIEKMKHITIVNIISKLIFTIAIFIFVKNEGDYILVPLFGGIGTILGGIYATYLIIYKFNQNFKFQKINILLDYLKEGAQFFLSRLSSVGYSNVNTLIIGLILSPTFVTYYYLADKVVNAILSMFDPVVQTVYPYLSKTFNYKFLLKLISTSISLSIIVVIFGYLLDDLISIVLMDEVNQLFMNILQIILFLIPVTVFYVILGAPLLLAKGYKKEFNLSIVYGFLVHIAILSSVYLYSINFEISEEGLVLLFAISLVISKLIVLGLRMYYVYKNKLYYKEG
jgi:polysaccharide transporter, PST family